MRLLLSVCVLENIQVENILHNILYHTISNNKYDNWFFFVMILKILLFYINKNKKIKFQVWYS